jgi:hypothetical protein
MSQLTAAQARMLTLGAMFLPADPADYENTRPCIQLPDGRQCYFYYDEGGVLRISVHLDGDAGSEDAPVKITVGGTVVYAED